jgi:hypothetical protein
MLSSVYHFIVGSPNILYIFRFVGAIFTGWIVKGASSSFAKAVKIEQS